MKNGSRSRHRISCPFRIPPYTPARPGGRRDRNCEREGSHVRSFQECGAAGAVFRRRYRCSRLLRRGFGTTTLANASTDSYFHATGDLDTLANADRDKDTDTYTDRDIVATADIHRGNNADSSSHVFTRTLANANATLHSAYPDTLTDTHPDIPRAPL